MKVCRRERLTVRERELSVGMCETILHMLARLEALSHAKHLDERTKSPPVSGLRMASLPDLVKS
jgi:hypothetical protein